MNYYQVGQTLVLSVNDKEGLAIAKGEKVLKKKYRFLKKYPWANGNHTTYLFHDTSKESLITNIEDLEIPTSIDTDDVYVIFVCGISGSGKTTFINKCFADRSVFTEEISLNGKNIGRECATHDGIIVFSVDVNSEVDVDFLVGAIERLGSNAMVINIICENGMSNVIEYFKTYKSCHVMVEADKQFIVNAGFKQLNVINEYGKGFSISNKHYKYASSYFKGRTRPFE